LVGRTSSLLQSANQAFTLLSFPQKATIRSLFLCSKPKLQSIEQVVAWISFLHSCYARRPRAPYPPPWSAGASSLPSSLRAGAWRCSGVEMFLRFRWSRFSGQVTAVRPPAPASRAPCRIGRLPRYSSSSPPRRPRPYSRRSGPCPKPFSIWRRSRAPLNLPVRLRALDGGGCFTGYRCREFRTSHPVNLAVQDAMECPVAVSLTAAVLTSVVRTALVYGSGSLLTQPRNRLRSGKAYSAFRTVPLASSPLCLLSLLQLRASAPFPPLRHPPIAVCSRTTGLFAAAAAAAAAPSIHGARAALLAAGGRGGGARRRRRGLVRLLRSRRPAPPGHAVSHPLPYVSRIPFPVPPGLP
jgi:hypothetical protein